MRSDRRSFFIVSFILPFLFCLSIAEAAVLWELNAESGTCDANVDTTVWDYTPSGTQPLNRMVYKCGGVVPQGTKFFRNTAHGDNGTSTSVGATTLSDTTKAWTVNEWAATANCEPYQLIDSAGTSFNVSSNTATAITVAAGNPASGAYRLVGQCDLYNEDAVTQINLTPGSTYYMGLFTRLNKVNGNDVYQDVSSPDSYSKMLEFAGNFRWILLTGWPNGVYTGSFNGFYTFSPYVSPTGCTSCTFAGSGSNEGWQNVAPYSTTNPFLAEYGKWYAVVMSIMPSSGTGANTDGLVEVYINGIKVASWAQRVNDSTTPNITRFGFMPTMAQPAYDAPLYTRDSDGFMFATTLSDVQNAGLMADPETASGGGGGPTKRFGGSATMRRER